MNKENEHNTDKENRGNNGNDATTDSIPHQEESLTTNDSIPQHQEETPVEKTPQQSQHTPVEETLQQSQRTPVVETPEQSQRTPVEETPVQAQHTPVKETPQQSQRSLDAHQTKFAQRSQIDTAGTAYATDLIKQKKDQIDEEHLRQHTEQRVNLQQSLHRPIVPDDHQYVNLTREGYGGGNSQSNTNNDEAAESVNYEQQDLDSDSQLNIDDCVSAEEQQYIESQLKKIDDLSPSAEHTSSIPQSPEQHPPKPNFSVGDVFTLTLRPVRQEYDDPQDHDPQHSTSSSDIKTLRVQIVEEDVSSEREWSNSDDPAVDLVNSGITKKEKHRYAAARYRFKEMVHREQLKKDEKKLLDANAQLEARIKTLTDIKAACITQLKSISTQKLCEGVSSLASLIPPGHEEALVAVRVVLYREIANQIRELAHIYNPPMKDQVVPEPNEDVPRKEEPSEGQSSQVFSLSRVTPSLFSIAEVDKSKIAPTQNLITCRVQEIPDTESEKDMPGTSDLSSPSKMSKPLDTTVEMLRRRIAEQQATATLGLLQLQQQTSPSVGLPHKGKLPASVDYQQELPQYTTLPGPGLTNNVNVAHPHTVRTVIRQQSRSDNGNAVPAQTTSVPAQLLLPMPILEQAAPIDLSRKKGKTRSDNIDLRHAKKMKSSALPDIRRESESESGCDELNLLATTALALDLTKQDAGAKDTALDLSRPVSPPEESTDIEMVRHGDADDESSREPVLSPQRAPIDLSKSTNIDQGDRSSSTGWKNVSREGPVVVWVQSMSTGIGELPQNMDKHNRHSKYEAGAQSSTQSSTHSHTQSSFQPSIQLTRHDAQPTKTPLPMQLAQQQQQHLVPPGTPSGSSRQEFLQSNSTSVMSGTPSGSTRQEFLQSNGTSVVLSSPERFHSGSAHSTPMDTISLSSSEDGDTSSSSSAYFPQDAGQMKLLQKNFASPQSQKVSRLIGDTRRERQRHASKKNRVKNQIMRKALLEDEKHLTSTNSKLRGTIEQLESIKCACLGMLATSNRHLTQQLTKHCAQQFAAQKEVLRPYWDSLGVHIALKVPDRLQVFDPMDIEGSLPFKALELKCDSKTWPEPMNPKFLSQVLMNVKVNGLEWNGSLLSKGDVTMVTEKGNENEGGLLGERPAIADGAGQRSVVADGVGKKSAITHGIGQRSAVADGTGQKAAVTYGVDQSSVVAVDVGQRSVVTHGIGQMSAVADDIGPRSAVADGKGQRSAVTHGIGQMSAVAYGIDQRSAVVDGNPTGERSAVTHGIGQRTVVVEGTGQRSALTHGIGQWVARADGISQQSAIAASSAASKEEMMEVDHQVEQH